MSHQRNLPDFANLFAEQHAGASASGWQQVGDRELLRAEQFVERGQGELATAVQEVRQMRLSDARLPREQRDTQRSPVDPSQQLGSHALLQLGKVHVENSLPAMTPRSAAFLKEKLHRDHLPIFWHLSNGVKEAHPVSNNFN